MTFIQLCANINTYISEFLSGFADTCMGDPNFFNNEDFIIETIFLANANARQTDMRKASVLCGGFFRFKATKKFSHTCYIHTSHQSRLYPVL